MNQRNLYNELLEKQRIKRNKDSLDYYHRNKIKILARLNKPENLEKRQQYNRDYYYNVLKNKRQNVKTYNKKHNIEPLKITNKTFTISFD